MELLELAEVDLAYRSLVTVDYEAGAQFYGTVEGAVRGERLSGALRLTNLAVQRPDNVNTPTLRGLLDTTDGATLWVTLDGLATLRPSDGARVFTTSVQLRTADPRYAWVNATLGLLEGVLRADRTSSGRLYECRPTIT